MKSRVIVVLFVIGFIAVAALSAFLTRKLFNMPVTAPPPLTREQATVESPHVLADAVIEVGNEPKATPSNPRPSSSKPTPRPPVSPSSAMTHSQVTPSTSAVGRVTFLSGTATAMNSAGKARLLSLRADIYRMDTVETGPAAKLEIKFTDDTVISQGERSVIVVEDCVFTPSDANRCCFVLRFVKGICRVLTGLITDLNPNRFKVKAKMATVGIRGCDLVFRSSPEKDDIYVIDMGHSKSVLINTTTDGHPIVDMASGQELTVDVSKQSEFTITEPQNGISITSGKGPVEAPITMSEVRGLITETSSFAPARYELDQRPNGAVLKITTDQPTPDSNETK